MSPSSRKLCTALVALVGLAALAVWLGSRATPAPPATFTLLDGSRQTTEDLRGKVALVNFWATSCTTCVAEMPQLMATYDKFRERGFDTVAVAMHYDPPSYVVHFAQTRRLPFKVALDHTGEVARAWGDIQLTPTTFVLNRRGEIVKSYVGAPDFAQLHQLIERLLEQTA